MASLKRIGFFWGEEKITVVDFEKNTPVQVVSSPLGSKANAASPFSSNLNEEIQITVILKKLLQDNHITEGSYYVSLPMKEIILRSFVIPYVKSSDIQNAVRFESKKYIPFDIQDLSYVFHTIPFVEGPSKRLQVIFFAARKEVLARYERILKQVNATVTYCEPYIVSLAKALLFRKEIKPSDHIAFLILDKNLGSICFIDKGIPQFIREFPVSSLYKSEETEESTESLNLKIVNEVLNSFDFYARQFNGEKIEQILVSSEIVQKDLINILEKELKVKIITYSSAIAGTTGQNTDMDAIYAMGACVVPPMESLSDFNFIADKTPKYQFDINSIKVLGPYREIIITFFFCIIFVVAAFAFFQIQLRLVQFQYDKVTAQEGAYANQTQDSIQADLQQNVDKLNQYKSVKSVSNMADIILSLASHLPKGTFLTVFSINYDANDANSTDVAIDIQGQVLNEDPDEQITIVNKLFTNFKSDKELSQFIKTVKLVTLTREMVNGRLVTGFVFHFS